MGILDFLKNKQDQKSNPVKKNKREIKKDGSPYAELLNAVAATNRFAKELFELNRQ